MKDLEKMKAKFEEELRLAKKSNEFELQYGVEPIVFVSSNCDTISVDCDNKLTKILLNSLPADKRWAVDHERDSENMLFYRVYSRRGYSERHSTLEVEFYHEGTKYCLKIKIDGNNLIAPFFHDGSRRITDTELSTWHPTDDRGLLNRNLSIPTKVFCAECILYYGGSELLIDEKEITRIIETLKHGQDD